MSDSDDAQLWLRYTLENRPMAALAPESQLYNPGLQNVQQAVEEALKAMLSRTAESMPWLTAVVVRTSRSAYPSPDGLGGSRLGRERPAPQGQTPNDSFCVPT